MAASNKEFILSLLTEERLRQLCGEWGVKVTDQRLRAAGIAGLLARKRSLDLHTVLNALSEHECALAASRLGVDARNARKTLSEQLGERSWRAVVRENRKYDVALETLSARVEEVIDGDTLRVTVESEPMIVRLRGIDAPESGPSDKAEDDLDRAHMTAPEMYALGKRSAEWLRKRLSDRDRVELRCQPTPQGPHRFLMHRGHRLLAYVASGDGEGTDVGAEMLERGLALVWPRGLKTRRYSHPLAERYITACNAALATQPGLWRDGLGRLCPRFASAKPLWTSADCDAACGCAPTPVEGPVE